jgi:hypothetical protein
MNQLENPANFKSILALIVPGVVAELCRNRGITDEEAFKLFYLSKVYSVLESEKTKLWHLSPLAIVELLDMETSGKKIIFPEEA